LEILILWFDLRNATTLSDEHILNGEHPELESGKLKEAIHLDAMYQNWFLDYASYVILERAVPEILDGLKPVQRRLLHAMKELDDGRYNKVANIIGHTMKYHPHGDASIGDALVQLGQKDLLIDTQGNWGNIHTGDSAAAPRYIEARPSKFSLDVVFNPKTTNWKASYDGRNKEPITLPVKFPLLLAMGVEGIAVGLASKILPHNFNELIEASIKVLQGKEFELFPDFPTGGLADVSKYNEGLRGGKIRLRAKVSLLDKKTLVISEIPYGTTTESVIESILTANDKGKIKIRKIDDNTARNVEILIHLAPGVSPDTTMDALYAFTQCEIPISANCCIIEDGKPRFVGVSEILRISTGHTVHLLKKELEIRLNELNEQLHYASIEKIFIENEVYEGIKKCKTDEEIDKAIRKGMKPFEHEFIRPLSDDDIKRLRKIPIERISKFNSNKADDVINGIREEMEVVKNHLAYLTEYAIDHFRQIRKKYGKERDRRTELRNFESIEAVKVAAANEKLYINREQGFAGTSLRRDEFVCDCSDIDDIIVFRSDGTFMVTKVADKVFIGHDVIHIQVFMKNDNRTIYNLIYRDGKNGKIMVKRFAVPGVTRDKEYTVTKGTSGSKVLYFSANPNGEAEVVKVDLKPKPRIKKNSFDFNFADLAIKGRNSIGNTLTKYAIKKIEIRQEGVSTLGSLKIWYDDTVMRLNTEERGTLLGAFSGADRIIIFSRLGHYRFSSFDLSSHFDEDMLRIEKYDPQRVYTIIYQDPKTKQYFIKRFIPEPTEKKLEFIDSADQFFSLSIDFRPQLQILFDMKQKSKGADQEEVNVEEFIGVKGYKAKGKRLTSYPVKKLNWLEPIIVDSEQEETKDEGGETRDEGRGTRDEGRGMKDEGRGMKEEGRAKKDEGRETRVEEEVKDVKKRGRKPKAPETQNPNPETQNPNPEPETSEERKAKSDEQLELEL